MSYWRSTPNSLPSMAAQYASAIACNRVFIDGNKQTAIVVFRTFLLLNGHDLQASQDEQFTMMMKLANREIDAVGLADWIRTWLMPARSRFPQKPKREVPVAVICWPWIRCR